LLNQHLGRRCRRHGAVRTEHHHAAVGQRNAAGRHPQHDRLQPEHQRNGNAEAAERAAEYQVCDGGIRPNSQAFLALSSFWFPRKFPLSRLTVEQALPILREGAWPMDEVRLFRATFDPRSHV
jgi:hypothetical protein